MTLGMKVLTAALLMVAATGKAAQGPMDAALRDSHNASTTLARFRGKPTVLFYEDRGSTHQNEAVKKELFARGKQHNLMSAANVVAVADLSGFDFFPARNFALRAVRDVEKKHGLPVLVDWNRTLCTAPWSLQPQVSSIVLLDGSGRPRFTHSGPMAPQDVEMMFQTLTELLGVDLVHPMTQAQR